MQKHGGDIYESIQLVFQTEIVCDHSNEFAVGWLSSIVLNGIAEIGIERIHITSIPCNLNCMANGTLNA